jgi:hypothetical protein
MYQVSGHKRKIVFDSNNQTKEYRRFLEQSQFELKFKDRK